MSHQNLIHWNRVLLLGINKTFHHKFIHWNWFFSFLELKKQFLYWKVGFPHWSYFLFFYKALMTWGVKLGHFQKCIVQQCLFSWNFELFLLINIIFKHFFFFILIFFYFLTFFLTNLHRYSIGFCFPLIYQQSYVGPTYTTCQLYTILTKLWWTLCFQ